MRKTLIAGLALAALAPAAQAQQTDNDQIAVTATVLKALDVQPGTPLSFGNVVAGGPAKTVGITGAGAGSWTIVGEQGTSVTLSATLPSVLTAGGGTTISIGSFTGGTNTVAGAATATAWTPTAAPSGAIPLHATSGELYVYIGATVTAPAGTATGSYTGTISLTATYSGI